MSYIVDASIAVKWFVPEVHRDRAISLLQAHGGDLEAPALILTEVANTVWKKVTRHEVEAQTAQAIVAALSECIAEFHATSQLIGRALDIALHIKHPVYDCLYIACAEITERPLFTADSRLQAVVLGTEFEPIVRSLDEAKWFPTLNPWELTIPKETIEEVITYSKKLTLMNDGIDDQLHGPRDGRAPFVPARVFLVDSPALKSIENILDGLFWTQVKDLICLCRFGRGHEEDGENWFSVQLNATSIGPNKEYLLSMLGYLEKGLQKFVESAAKK